MDSWFYLRYGRKKINKRETGKLNRNNRKYNGMIKRKKIVKRLNVRKRMKIDGIIRSKNITNLDGRHRKKKKDQDA